jgi:LMBR1 domain-containing protein 1
MGVDVFLLIFVLAVIGGSVYANVRLLQYYQDVTEAGIGQSVLVKAIIVISLTLCWLLNILLPVDVRNSRPVPGLLDMRLIWTFAFITLATFLVIVIPAAMFYHEAHDDVAIGKKVKRHVLCNMFFMLIFVGSGLAIGYAFLSEASMPVREYICPVTHWTDAAMPLTPVQIGQKVCGAATDAHLNFKVGFQIYMIAFMCFIGWFFFVTFGGIGLSALPIDLILEFVDRPRYIDEITYQQERREMGTDTQDLLRRAQALKDRDDKVATKEGWRARRAKAKLQADYNKWKAEVAVLEEDFEKLQISKHEKGESIVISVMKLVFGILFAIMSILWILHTILFTLIKQYTSTAPTTFLNGLFGAFESPGLYPFGVALFGTFSLYLLLCVVKGCLKFGMRIFIFFSIHPMKMKGTPLNSILFNVLIMLITSATVVQFAQQAFSDYARLTDADVVFSAQIRYLTFYSFFFKNNIFIYALLVWFTVTIIYLFCKGPRDKHGRRSSRKKGKKDKDKKDKKGKKDKADKKRTQKPPDDVPANL